MDRVELPFRMSRPKPHKSALDMSAIAFPTDRVTIGMMRRLQPELFASERDKGFWDTDVSVFATMSAEGALARKAFALAAGTADPHPADDRRDLILMLNDDYRRYGISQGLQHTYQLVRAFEAAAATQAQKKQL